jgi:hypothetical protein
MGTGSPCSYWKTSYLSSVRIAGQENKRRESEALSEVRTAGVAGLGKSGSRYTALETSLRVLQVAVSEFGYSKETGSPNSNYHFHGCYFGPFLPWECLVEIFREESRKAFGVESRGVIIDKARRGYRSALAHALKYAGLKLPAGTPEGLALYEKVLVGVRRYAVRGFLQGVALEAKKRSAPKCPECKKELKRVSGLGVVPLSEIQDIPLLPEDEPNHAGEFKDDEFCFLESGEMASHAPRAPC